MKMPASEVPWMQPMRTVAGAGAAVGALAAGADGAVGAAGGAVAAGWAAGALLGAPLGADDEHATPRASNAPRTPTTVTCGRLPIPAPCAGPAPVRYFIGEKCVGRQSWLLT